MLLLSASMTVPCVVAMDAFFAFVVVVVAVVVSVVDDAREGDVVVVVGL